MTGIIDREKHPCFNIEAKGSCARVHLPVAPKCNMKCNYCNRKNDCVNESRPGVTSAILAPDQAVSYLEAVMEAAPETTVAGIAGPGDAFAEPERTIETLRLVRERFPSLILCLATNGLNAVDYAEDLAKLDVSHVTITVNSIDPEIGRRIYSWVRHKKIVYRKEKAAQYLLDRQLLAIAALKALGVIVKVNTIIIPGVNDGHALEVSKKMAEMGVDIQNLMPIYPNRGTLFENIVSPSNEELVELRGKAGKIIPQMTHCTRCRADAVGLLGADRSAEFRGCMADQSKEKVPDSKAKPYVAVATLEGALVNQHLGEAHRFQIWSNGPNGLRLVEERPAPEPGGGGDRWRELARTLKDCRAVLVSGVGEKPKRILNDNNISPIEMNGYIRHGLEAVYKGTNIAVFRTRRKGVAKGNCCSGDGVGCG